MKIFLITSVPLVPPWDQGDKNLAYSLTTQLPHLEFQVMTARHAPPPQGKNLIARPLYWNRTPSLAQKLWIYGWFWHLSLTQSRSGDGAAPDLYHLIYQPMGLSSLVMRWLPALKRRPTLHTVPAAASGRPLSARLFFADRLVALSEYGYRRMQALGLKHVDCIPPGIDLAMWLDTAARQAFHKQQLGVAGAPVLLYPGHFSPRYGLQDLLAAMPEIIARVPGTRLILACRPRTVEDQLAEAEVKEQLQRSGLDQSIRIYGTVGDMRPLISASDLVVLPFRSMDDKVDLPTTLLEALAAGKPAVVSDISPMNELLGENLQAIAGGPFSVGVPAGDVHALREAVASLLLDSTRRAAMGARGQRLVRQRFDIRRVARQYERLYQEMRA